MWRADDLDGEVEAVLGRDDAIWDGTNQGSHPKGLGCTGSEAGCQLWARMMGTFDGEGSKELSYLVEAC